MFHHAFSSFFSLPPPQQTSAPQNTKKRYSRRYEILCYANIRLEMCIQFPLGLKIIILLPPSKLSITTARFQLQIIQTKKSPRGQQQQKQQ